MKRIKIGHQMQADLPIHLIASGKIICGAFEYSGAKTSEFRGVFEAIAFRVECLPPNTEFDVSNYRFWDAMNIYEEYIARPWKKSISAQKMERLAVETEIFLMLEPLRAEFKRSVATKWKRIFRNSKSDDPNRPTKGWHLCRMPRLVDSLPMNNKHAV